MQEKPKSLNLIFRNIQKKRSLIKKTHILLHAWVCYTRAIRFMQQVQLGLSTRKFRDV
jgi:hypothetical protein